MSEQNPSRPSRRVTAIFDLVIQIIGGVSFHCRCLRVRWTYTQPVVLQHVPEFGPIFR